MDWSYLCGTKLAWNKEHFFVFQSPDTFQIVQFIPYNAVLWQRGLQFTVNSVSRQLSKKYFGHCSRIEIRRFGKPRNPQTKHPYSRGRFLSVFQYPAFFSLFFTGFVLCFVCLFVFTHRPRPSRAGDKLSAGRILPSVKVCGGTAAGVPCWSGEVADCCTE